MVPVGLVLATGLFLSGCANTTKDVTAGWTPEKIYSEARDEAKAGAWADLCHAQAFVTGRQMPPGAASE